MCRNQSQKGRKKTEFVNSVDEVERITGYDFFPQLPDDVEKKVEHDFSAHQFELFDKGSKQLQAAFDHKILRQNIGIFPFSTRNCASSLT